MNCGLGPDFSLLDSTANTDAIVRTNTHMSSLALIVFVVLRGARESQRNTKTKLRGRPVINLRTW